MATGTMKLVVLLVCIRILVGTVLGEEIRRQHPRTFQREIIRPRLQTLEIAEAIIRLRTLEIREGIIRPRLHTVESAEISTSSTSDSELDIEQQPISNTIQDVREKQREHLNNIVQFLAMAVPFFSIIIWVDGWLRVIEAVIYLFYVSTILRQLFRFGYHTPTNAGNNDAATTSPYVSLSQLIARIAIISIVIAGLNTVLYKKER